MRDHLAATAAGLIMSVCGGDKAGSKHRVGCIGERCTVLLTAYMFSNE